MNGRSSLALLFVLVCLSTAHALEPGQTEKISPRDVYVSDGDTIRVRGEVYRLVDFDAPEIGRTARCEREVELGYEAKARVVDLVHEAKTVTLERVACSCAPAAPEGTMFCNYARRCGTLRADGEDVGRILIREGLAKAYPYRWNHVPRKPGWCG